jgi:hypothetical protein
MRVEGSVLVVNVRPTINQMAQTIDTVTGKLQHSHVQFLILLMEQFESAGAPKAALRPLMTLKDSAEKRDAIWFNVARHGSDSARTLHCCHACTPLTGAWPWCVVQVASHYLEATHAALDAKKEVFETMASKRVWSMVTSETTQTAMSAISVKAECMVNSARLCAENKMLPEAICMLNLSLDLCAGTEIEMHPRLRRDDWAVVQNILDTEKEVR